MSAKKPVHVGDTPWVRLTLLDASTGQPMDVSTSTVRTIKLLADDGDQIPKAASFSTDGTDGKIEVQLSGTDLDVAGTWTVQGFIDMPTWTGHFEKKQFKVFAPIF